MEIKTKKYIAFSGILILAAVFGYWLYPGGKNQYPDPVSSYIYDKSHEISLEDVKKAREPLPRRVEKSSERFDTGMEADEIDLRELFAEALINSHTTVNYFKHLENRFRESINLGDHLEQVREHLFSEFSESEATKLYETYRKYIECEIALADQFRLFGRVRTPEDAIDILHQIQAFRRDALGDELADRLFGAEVKAQEYVFRRAVIVGDKTLYGAEKEARLKTLNTDMWGEEADEIEDHPNDYQRYRERLVMYERDLSEIAYEPDRQEKIKEIRLQFFTPEAVGRLEAVDRQIAHEEQRESEYREREAYILNDPDLAETERDARVRELQDKMFGEAAEAFRRSEFMRVEREKMIREYEGKGIQLP